jgi:hypothetical protein
MYCKSAPLFMLIFLLPPVAVAGSTTVPMQLRGNYPVIIAQVDGIDVPLVFDLPDESALALSQTVIDRIKTSPAGETHRALDAMGNVIQSGTFKVQRLQIGDTVFTDVIGRPDLHDPAYQSENLGQQGYLGTALLKSYKVVLDYPHRQLTLISPGSTKKQLGKCRGVQVPFLPDWNGTPITKAITDFGGLTAVWDTGTPVSILRRPNAKKLNDDVIDETATTKSLVLGGTDFGPLTFVVADYAEPAGTDMFIGYSFFINHVVCVDFPGKRFLIQR